MSAEAFNYPMYGILYHPEYQWLNFTQENGAPFNTSFNDDTFALIQHFSNLMFKEASASPNRYPTDEEITNTRLTTLTKGNATLYSVGQASKPTFLVTYGVPVTTPITLINPYQVE